MKDGRSERAARQREETRARILEAALPVFATHGYHATSVSDLVAAAEVARGTFYLHFVSKQAVFVELLDALVAAFRTSVHGVDTGPTAPPLADQLVASVLGILDAARASRPLARILFREAVGLDAVVDARIEGFEAMLHGYLQASLENGVRLGLLRPHDGEVAATAIYGALRQAIVRYVVGDAPLDAARVARGLVELHLRGLTVEED